MRELLNPSIEALSSPSPTRLARTAVITVIGFALYGYSVGFWRSPVMGIFVAVKMPLLIAFTLAANGLLNGMLALLLGSRLGFVQSLQALLGAFSISALILGSIAPVTLFMALNAPAPDSPDATMAHSGYLLTHTALIAIAGFIGVMRLRALLIEWCANRRIAQATLLAWIAGNAFLGAQFSWILRPFFGNPLLDVAFLREEPMKGSFYGTVWRAAHSMLTHSNPSTVFNFFILGAAILAVLLLVKESRQRNIEPTKP